MQPTYLLTQWLHGNQWRHGSVERCKAGYPVNQHSGFDDVLTNQGPHCLPTSRSGSRQYTAPENSYLTNPPHQVPHACIQFYSVGGMSA